MSSNEEPGGEVNLRINNRWRVRNKIGSGSFGDIYVGVNIENGKEVGFIWSLDIFVWTTTRRVTNPQASFYQRAACHIAAAQSMSNYRASG